MPLSCEGFGNGAGNATEVGVFAGFEDELRFSPPLTSKCCRQTCFASVDHAPKTFFRCGGKAGWAGQKRCQETTQQRSSSVNSLELTNILSVLSPSSQRADQILLTLSIGALALGSSRVKCSGVTLGRAASSVPTVLQMIARRVQRPRRPHLRSIDLLSADASAAHVDFLTWDMRVEWNASPVLSVFNPWEQHSVQISLSCPPSVQVIVADTAVEVLTTSRNSCQHRWNLPSSVAADVAPHLFPGVIARLPQG